MSARPSSRITPRGLPNDGILGRLLDPIDRLAETIYSILILLTFTLAFRIFKLGGDPAQMVSATYVNELLFAALAATLAWGVIDGLMHVLIAVLQRSERYRLLRQIQAAQTEQECVDAVADEFDYILEPITGEHERQALYQSALAHLRHGQPRPIGFKREDFVGALGCVLVALIAVLPSLLPFVLLSWNYALAIRVSNVVSFIMLFNAGYRWGRYTGTNPWKTGLLLVAVGVIMVAVAIPLGG